MNHASPSAPWACQSPSSPPRTPQLVSITILGARCDPALPGPLLLLRAERRGRRAHTRSVSTSAGREGTDPPQGTKGASNLFNKLMGEERQQLPFGEGHLENASTCSVPSASPLRPNWCPLMSPMGTRTWQRASQCRRVRGPSSRPHCPQCPSRNPAGSGAALGDPALHPSPNPSGDREGNSYLQLVPRR